MILSKTDRSEPHLKNPYVRIPKMTQVPVKHLLLIAACSLALGVGCKKKQDEVVDVESPSSSTTTPTKTTPEPTPSKNDKPAEVKKDKKDDKKPSDTSNSGASNASGEAWLKKASGVLAKAFVSRNRDGVFAAAKMSKDVQIKLERVKDGKSKKTKIADMKVFTQCLTGGPKTKCPISSLPVKTNKAGAIDSCDAECCKFKLKKDDVQAGSVFLTKACFKKPEAAGARPKLKAIKLVIKG